MSQVPARRPADRTPVLVGANPGVQLFDDEGSCTAYVSCWRVDWSTHGRGEAVVLWRPDGVVVAGSDRALSLWLADAFVRHFPELDGLGWPAVEYRRCRASVQVDLATGAVAQTNGIDVRLDGVLDRRCFSTDEFDLDGTPRSLQLVLAPCAHATIHDQDRRIAGEIRRTGTEERPGSSGFVTDAEVWRW